MENQEPILGYTQNGQPTQDAAPPSIKRHRKHIVSRCIIDIIGMLSGIAFTFLGYLIKTCFDYGFIDLYSGSYNDTTYETYGGDAYTGIQNAVADTSWNVRVLGKVLEHDLRYFSEFFLECYHAILVIITCVSILVGIVIFCYFAHKFFETLGEK
jgi:hypothetical protein